MSKKDAEENYVKQLIKVRDHSRPLMMLCLKMKSVPQGEAPE
jgi:hypothetical protein